MRLRLHPELARARVNACAPAALAEGGEILLSAARGRCPLRTGRLRASGCVRAEGRRAAVGFTAPYAACVHERGGKFLEGPVNDPGVQGEILSAMAAHFKF